jgi:undecaprenyl-diphosphatase
MIAFEAMHEDATDGHDIAAMSHRDAFLIGIAQSFAIIPGVSRSAASIIGGLALGLPRRTVVEFSFLIAVPTMAAATGLDLIKNASVFTQSDMTTLAVGFLVAFVTAWLGVRFLLSYIRTHDFTGFGVYRICAGLIAWMFIG